MANIDEDIQLPDQPSTTGTVQHIPLGGDGFSAPKGAYVIQQATLTGDGSTVGFAHIRIRMDQVYCSLVSYVSWSVAQGTPANIHFHSRIATLQTSQTDIVAEQLQAGLETFIASNVTSTGQNVSHTWNPTPIILPGDNAQGVIDLHWANVGTDVWTLSALIYLFDVRVRSTAPMGPLLWARGST